MSIQSNNDIGMCKCGCKKRRWHDDLCHKCIEENKSNKRQEELNKIASLDINTRLRNIEAYIYDQKNISNSFRVMR